MAVVTICSECDKPAFSREGWCLRCLRRKLQEKFGPVQFARGGSSRTADQRQARNDEQNPWGENAVRAMEDIDD